MPGDRLLASDQSLSSLCPVPDQNKTSTTAVESSRTPVESNTTAEEYQMKAAMLVLRI